MAVNAPARLCPPAAPDARERRMLWRCRRGMRELDLMLERFARQALPRAAPRDRQAFEQLLGLTDPQLARYLLGGITPPDPRLARLTRAIRTYVAPPGDRALF